MNDFLQFLNLEGPIWMALFSAMIFLGSVACIVGTCLGYHWDLPSGVITAYLGALGIFAGSKTIPKIWGVPPGPPSQGGQS